MTFSSATDALKNAENPQEVVAYEAPAIESVLAPEALEREVLYAGNPISNPTAG